MKRQSASLVMMDLEKISHSNFSLFLFETLVFEKNEYNVWILLV